MDFFVRRKTPEDEDKIILGGEMLKDPTQRTRSYPIPSPRNRWPFGDQTENVIGDQTKEIHPIPSPIRERPFHGEFFYLTIGAKFCTTKCLLEKHLIYSFLESFFLDTKAFDALYLRALSNGCLLVFLVLE